MERYFIYIKKKFNKYTLMISKFIVQNSLFKVQYDN